MPFRILAAAQTVPLSGDVKANIRQHVRLVHLAADRGARVVVFPELSLTGYELGLARQLAFEERDRRLDPLVAVARGCATTLVVGAPVRLETGLHIGAFVLSAAGGIDVYTKHRLGAFAATARVDGIVPPAESTVFRPGIRRPLVPLDGYVAAVAVCADTGSAAHPRNAAARGATTYLASMFVIPSEYEAETARLASHAGRHGMAVVFANYGGPSGGLASAGGSAVWSDRGEPLTRLPPSGAGIVLARETGAGWQAETIAPE